MSMRQLFTLKVKTGGKNILVILRSKMCLSKPVRTTNLIFILPYSVYASREGSDNTAQTAQPLMVTAAIHSKLYTVPLPPLVLFYGS